MNTTLEIIEDLRQGKMIILMDDEDRENEGDLVMVSEQVQPKDINFMAKNARGLICLTLTREHCERLDLSLMSKNNGTVYDTNFTVSIEAAQGVTTGISAADRAHTVRTAVGANVQAKDIVQPGHVFPLMAREGGVMTRAGHTEAGCDLARLAGFTPSATIVEIMNDDGTMARRDDLMKFAEEHNLKIGTIADLIQFRSRNERTIEKVEEQTIIVDDTEFDLHIYRDTIVGNTHLAVTLGKIEPGESTLVRVHMPDMLRDIIGARNGRPKWSAQSVLQRIAAEGSGVMVLLGRSETRVAPSIEDFFRPDDISRPLNTTASGAYLNVGTGSQILRELGVHKMRLMSTEMKYNAISGFDLEIEEYITCEA
ncbi:MAG: 3,4-dihydroxy-2-butanone-4-phosphate synthase [Gammaproteobacteria bacterium]|nr:3,4-dihydroxy-2-butanone-4-phosphate synthase [Gammaproteobacteria bacterium]MDP6164851.1 3,4-dihydroxy-2-butanone-4-phosphate synthase [Gammaproteobacteria bacterium]